MTNGESSQLFCMGKCACFEPEEQEPCEDAISRKAVIEILQSLLDASMIEFFTDKINQLPSVTPTVETAEWKSTEDLTGRVYCTNCKKKVDATMNYKYCPNCGRKMVK